MTERYEDWFVPARPRESRTILSFGVVRSSLDQYKLMPYGEGRDSPIHVALATLTRKGPFATSRIERIQIEPFRTALMDQVVSCQVEWFDDWLPIRAGTFYPFRVSYVVGWPSGSGVPTWFCLNRDYKAKGEEPAESDSLWTFQMKSLRFLVRGPAGSHTMDVRRAWSDRETLNRFTHVIESCVPSAAPPFQIGLVIAFVLSILERASEEPE